MSATNEKKTLLVVDDARINRAILVNTLNREYDILEAADGAEALAILERDGGMVSAVVLDLLMPNMDGFEVLGRMRDNPALSSIPVIVATAADDDESAVRAFDLGAMDLFAKPFNETVLLKRVQNIISRKEADAVKARNETLSLLREQDQKHIEELRRQAEYDSLTGLYNYHGFCLAVDRLLEEDPEGDYLIVRYDISHFKVVNDLWGKEAGDRLLCALAESMNSKDCGISIAGRVGSDDFLGCYRRERARRDHFPVVFDEVVRKCGITNKLQIICGVAEVDDHTMKPELLCDRAELALERAKLNASEGVSICFFEDSMKRELLREQEIVENMHAALENGEFQCYLQPQVDQFSRRISGAEALVRWIRPGKGMISPAEFIPIFEKNGFVEKLDRYVCEQVCRLQHERLRSGQRVIPISVNISRIDVYDETLCDFLVSLLKKYELPASLLHLEITESAFMENAAQLIRTVNKLQGAGFVVEIDDFGSAYSSLNLLKEISADVLKLDINFISGNDAKSQRSGNILSSILRMSRRLGMTMIVEGVETQQQTAYLKNIGFRYVQGYLFYRPMPVADFVKLIDEGVPALAPDDMPDDDTQELDYWEQNSQNELIMNTYIGSAAIIEYDHGNVEVLRANTSTYETLKMTADQVEEYRVRLPELFDDENRAIYLGMFEEAIANGKEAGCEVYASLLHPDDPQWFRVRVKLLSRRVNSYLFYSTVENTTGQHRLIDEWNRDRERYLTIMERLGAVAFEWNMETHEFFASSGYAGYALSTQDPAELLKNEGGPDVIHSDDRDALLAFFTELRNGKESTETVIRLKMRDGSFRWTKLGGMPVRDAKGNLLRVIGTLEDAIRKVDTGEVL